MPIHFVSGDPLLTACQTLALGHNRLGRSEMDDCTLSLMRKFPAAFSGYERRCKQNRQASGDLYHWTQSTPKLLLMTVRDSAIGATRLRHVQTCLMTLARDMPLYKIDSLAITAFATAYEWDDVKSLLIKWLGNSPLPIVVYERYHAGVQADEQHQE